MSRGFKLWAYFTVKKEGGSVDTQHFKSAKHPKNGGSGAQRLWHFKECFALGPQQ